jgi:prevent-host-death family protein
MTVLADFHPHTLSVTEAAAAGVPSLVRDAENGDDVIVARRGRPVAAVVSMRRLDQLRVLEADLRDLALVMTRAATDSGTRTGLDEVISAFGFDRSELEDELRNDLAAGRE